MLKKIIFILTFLLIQITYADTCPTVAEIKFGIYKGWQPLKLGNCEPLSPSEEAEFKSKVSKFVSANWVEDMPDAPGECFYSGNIPDPDYLGTFLAKNTGEPDKNSGNWHEACFDIMQCDASINDCRFEEI
jgi:hypothetical protein